MLKKFKYLFTFYLVIYFFFNVLGIIQASEPQISDNEKRLEEQDKKDKDLLFSLGMYGHWKKGETKKQTIVKKRNKVEPVQQDEKGKGYLFSLGMHGQWRKGFDIEAETGEVEMTRQYFSFTIGKPLMVKKYRVRPELSLSWNTIELNYNKSSGIMEFKPSLVYGFKLNVALLEISSIQISAFSLFEKGSFDSDSFIDNINSRTGLPFSINLDMEQFKIGTELKWYLSESVALGSHIQYFEQKLDMGTGWFINTPAKMKIKQNIGGGVHLLFKVSDTYISKLEFEFDNALAVGISLHFKH